MSVKNPFFSIVMPVYNVEKYLDDAIKSILDQTFDSFELILVDDGSTDSSGLIMDRYRNTDSRVVLIRQPNSGLSASRNKGLEHSRGKYVYFIDSDDMLDKAALRYIHTIISENGEPDVVAFKAKPFLDEAYDDREGKRALQNHLSYYEYDYLAEKSYPGAELYLEMIRRHTFLPNAWLYVIKKTFLREKKLKFVEGIVNEDEIFSRNLFFCTKNIYLTNKKFYRYRVRKGSIMQSGVYRHRVLSLITVAEEIYALYERENIPELKSDALRFYNEAVDFQLKHFPAESDIVSRLISSDLFLPNLHKFRPAGQDFEMYISSPHTDQYIEDIYQPLTARIISSYILDNSIFFDLGAGFGYFSLIAASRAKAKKIVSVEPDLLTSEILSKNVNTNRFQNIIIYDEPLLDGEEKRGVFDSLASFDDGVSNLFFKINANGREAAVLDRIKPIVKRAFPRVRLVIEYSPKKIEQAGTAPEDLLNILFSLGFEVLIIDEKSGIIRKVDTVLPDPLEDEALGPNRTDIQVNLLCLPKNSPVSVLFFSHSSLLYGAERSLQAFVSDLPRRGMVPTVVLPFDGPLKQYLEENGAVTLVHPFGWWSDQTQVDRAESQMRLARDFRAVQEDLLPVLRRVNPDIVLTNTSVIPWGGVSAFFINKPHLWYVHELGVPERGINFYYPREVIAEYIKGGASLVILNSVFTQKSFFGESTQMKSEIIYPFSEMDQKEPANSESYFQREDSFKLACLGAIQPGKGQVDAIHALKELVSAGNNVELVFAGGYDIDYHKLLMALIEEFDLASYIHFAGFLDFPFALYEQADAILICYRDEPFGLVTLEAMYLAKPIVAAASGGTLELIDDEKEGLLYPPGDFVQLSKKIKRLINEPSTRVRIGHNAAEKARKKFSKEVSLNSFYQTLRKVASEANQSSQSFFYWVLALERKNRYIQLEEKDAQLADRDAQLADRDAQLADRDAQLTAIYSSKIWRLGLWLRRIRVWIAPPGSIQARLMHVILSIAMKMIRRKQL